MTIAAAHLGAFSTGNASDRPYSTFEGSVAFLSHRSWHTRRPI